MSATLTKPKLNEKAVLDFVTSGAADAAEQPAKKSSAADAPAGAKSGLVPVGDVRLTANIREDVHMRLKMRAVQERTTIGELIERWVDSW